MGMHEDPVPVSNDYIMCATLPTCEVLQKEVEEVLPCPCSTSHPWTVIYASKTSILGDWNYHIQLSTNFTLFFKWLVKKKERVEDSLLTVVPQSHYL